jgi:hypothetical protein
LLFSVYYQPNNNYFVSIFAHPEVTNRLCGEDFDLIETLEEAHGKSITIRSENNYHIELLTTLHNFLYFLFD